MEPPHKIFVKRHHVNPPSLSTLEVARAPPEQKVEQEPTLNEAANLSQGDELSSSISSDETEPWSHRFTYCINGSKHLAREDTIHSVFLATGLFMDADEHIYPIPDRHAASTRATLRWFIDLCSAGVGMFVNAYVIITTGQIKTVWHHEYPTCWGPNENQMCPYNIQCEGLFPNTPTEGENGWTPNPDLCNPSPSNTYPDNMLCTLRVTSAVSYSEFAGIMGGMLIFGFLSDKIGRKGTGILTSCFMVLGLVGMVFYTDSHFNRLFQVWSVFFALFGFGVGGEYPLSASCSSESHLDATEQALQDNMSQRQMRMELELAKSARRGETISIVFAMQGVGAVFGSLVLIALIYFGNQSAIECTSAGNNSTGNGADALDGVWRSFYFIGFLQVLPLLIYRSVVSEESETFAKVQARKQRRKAEHGNVFLSKILWFYAPRLLGTAGCWFLWDIGFYGLKLYSGPIFQVLNPGGSLLVTNGLILLLNVISLVGNFAAAAIIDRTSIGRVKLQMFSFFLCSVLFLATGLLLDRGIAPSWVVTVLFYLANLAGQCGANSTTYVMAAETYPTELRSTCHGISAFAGKLGALLATIVFSYVSISWIFFITAITSVVALVFTWIFSVDLTHVSLSEHDAQLELFLEGQPEKYMGRLNKDEHLSNYERWTKRHGSYDPFWASNLSAKYDKITSERKIGSDRRHDSPKAP